MAKTKSSLEKARDAYEKAIVAGIHIDIGSHTGRSENPALRIGTSRQKRPSQITGHPPTKRLVKRRRKNSVEGYFPNPIDTSMVHGQRKDAVSNVYLTFYVYQKHDLGEGHFQHKFVCACDHFRIAAELVKLLNTNAQPRVRYISVNTAVANIE